MCNATLQTGSSAESQRHLHFGLTERFHGLLVSVNVVQRRQGAPHVRPACRSPRAINARLMERSVLQSVNVKRFDGLESWAVLDTDFKWGYCPTSDVVTTKPRAGM